MTKARILLVEDEIIIAMEIENSLQNLGYNVTSVVSSGDDAISKAEEDKPDLIVMDIRIQGDKDGIETAEIIRHQFDIPVVFSTAYLDEERIERAKITMPFGYVLKPIQERDLKVTLEMALYVARVDAERKRVETALAESEELHRTTLSTISDAVLITDDNGEFTFVCPNIHFTFGFSSDEVWAIGNVEKLLGQNIFDLKDLESKGELTNIRREITDKNDIVHNLLINIKKVSIKGGTVLYSCRDITDLAKIEETLLKTELRYRSLFDSINDGIAVHELVYDASGTAIDYKIVDVNPRYETIFEIRKEDVVEALVSKICNVDYLPSIETFAKVAETGEPVQFETYFPPLEKYFSISAFSFEKGKFATTFQDITERKKAEGALLEAQTELNITLDTVTDGIWKWNLKTDELWFSDQYYKMLDYEPGAFHATFESWINLIHPEDKDKALETVNEFLKTKPDVYKNEFRLKTPNGNFRWIKAKAKVVEWDESGSAVRMIGNHEDVTDRKNLEMELYLRQQKHEFHMENTILGYVEFDPQGIITAWNRVAEQLFEYSKGEAIGKNTFNLIIPQEIHDEIKTVWDEVVRGKNVEYTNENVTKSGKQITCRWFNTCLKDMNSNTIGVASLFQKVS